MVLGGDCRDVLGWGCAPGLIPPTEGTVMNAEIQTYYHSVLRAIHARCATDVSNRTALIEQVSHSDILDAVESGQAPEAFVDGMLNPTLLAA